MHGGVGGRIEGVYIWLGNAGAGKPDKGAGAERDDGIGGEGEAEVGFHRAILIAGADCAELELEAALITAGVFLGELVVGRAIGLRNGIS